MNIRFAPEVTNVYERTFHSKGRIVINRGGTRSSKTYSICQLAIRWLLTGRIRQHQIIPRGIFSIVRKTFPALKASALRDVIEILEEHNIMQYIQYNKTDHVMTLPGSGRYLEFFSVDQQQKVRSRGRSILYAVEGNELDYMNTFYQMLMRTKDLVLIDLNPDDPYNWINEELEQKRAQKRGDVEVIVSTYKDNPKLGIEHVQEIEYMKEVDEELWQVYGLGQYGKITGLVFPNIEIVKSFPDQLSLHGHGLDFGFTNDPSALMQGGLQNKIDLHLDEMFYSTGLTNSDIAGAFRTHQIRSEIFADAADPKSIKELQGYGFNVRAAKKGPDSVSFGINTLKKYKLHITERSYNFIKEARKYKWKVDQEGKPTNVPIDMFNHCFVGSTLIDTTNGLKPIKDITTNDLVLTSKGPRRVLIKWENGIKKVVQYRIASNNIVLYLQCTEDHLIKTNLGWKEISKIERGDQLYLSKSLMAKYTDSTQGKGTIPEAPEDYMSWHGNTLIIAKCRRNTTSTTSMETQSITKSQTLRSFLIQSISANTQKAGLRIIKNTKSYLFQGVLKRLRYGTQAKKVTNGIVSMQNALTLGIKHMVTGRAKFAQRNMKQGLSCKDSAQTSVRLSSGLCLGSTMKKDHARDVQNLLPAINTRTSNFAHLAVVHEIKVRTIGSEQVYDLEVDQDHEYFANGVLVHNCWDASRYYAVMKLAKLGAAASMTGRAR